jgi:TolA-binding protein
MNLRRSLPIVTRLIGAIALAGILASGAGCGTLRSPFGPKYTVPEKNSPREQAQIADREFRQAQQLVEPSMRREAFRKTIKAFQTVQTRFPEDRVYTPAAALMEGDLYYQIEDWRRAEAAYRRVIARYPTIPDVHAGALMGLGLSLYEQKRNREGNEVLAQFVDQYGRSDDPAIQARVRRARSELDRVR